MGRAPQFVVRYIAETQPSMWLGVTTWRSVFDVITQMTGPNPNRKNASAGSSAVS